MTPFNFAPCLSLLNLGLVRTVYLSRVFSIDGGPVFGVPIFEAVDGLILEVLVFIEECCFSVMNDVLIVSSTGNSRIASIKVVRAALKTVGLAIRH